MKQRTATIIAFLFLFFGCGSEETTIITTPPPVIVNTGELQLHLATWNEPDKFIIQGTTWIGEPSGLTAAVRRGGHARPEQGDPMLTLPAKFKNLLGQKNTPAYIAKLLESEIFAEETLQADWAANSGYDKVRWTSPVAVGDVVVDGGILDGGAWLQKTSGATVRAAHSAVVYNGKMYVFGGTNIATLLNDVWEYDIAGDSWLQKTSGATIRSNHSAVVYNGKMYVFGGWNGTSTFFNDVWEYDIAGDSWLQKTSGATIRNNHSAVVYNGKMYVFGGFNGTVHLNDVWEYDIAGDSWMQKTSGATVRAGHSAVVYNGKMYVFGGWNSTDYFNDVWEYDIAGDSWTQKTSGATGRRDHSAVAFGHYMFIFGGYNGSELNNLWLYDFLSHGWAQITSGATVRAHHSAIVYNDGKMYVFGGAVGSSTKNDIWEVFLGYHPSGYIQTQTMDLGSVPTVDGQWRFQNLIPAGTSISYEAWAMDELPGLSWSLVQQLGTETYVYSLADLGGGIVVAGTTGGNIYRSIDSGASWSLVQRLGTETQVLSLADLGGGIVVAGTYPTGRIYRSIDSGASWSLVQQLGTETQVLSLADLGGGIVVAGTTGGNVYRSIDSGASWSLVQQLGTESFVLSLADLGGGIVVAGTSVTGQVYRSTNYGASWSLVQQLGTETQVLSLADLGGGIVIAGTTGGNIYRSIDSGASWSLVQQLGTETQVYSLADLGGGIAVAGTGANGRIYRSTDSGASWSLVQRLGTETQVRSLALLGEWAVVAGTSLGGQIYRSDPSVPLGTVVDGQAITVRARYYVVKATLTATVELNTSPTLRSIMARFPIYRGYATDPRLGYEASILSVSALSTKISDFDPSTITQITLHLAFSDSISEYLATRYPKNKEVRIFAGFIDDGFVETDFVEFYRGLIDDWPVEERDTISIKVKDYFKLWAVPVPVKWQSAADDLTWTDMHPVDVMLDIFRGYIGSTDAEIDQTSFAEVKAATAGWKVTRTITGNTIQAKVLLEELRLTLSAYFIPQPNGRIKLKRWDASEASVFALTDRDFIRKKWDPNAKELWNEIDVYFGHAENPTYPTTADLSGDDLKNFYAWVLAGDATSKTLWKETNTKQLKDKWTRIAGSAQVEARWTNLITRYANPPEIINATVDSRHMAIEVGDIGDITTMRAPSTDMTGITAKKFQVIQKTPDLGKDQITLILLRRDSA